MKVLVIGSGGREHALVKACMASPLVDTVVAAPGNGGMAAEVTCLPLEVEDVAATVTLAKAERVDFVIVGPEVPLALGVADALRAEGIAVYGPGRDGARLEASKVYTKDFLVRHRIPTASAASFTDLSKAVDYLSQQSYPLVIKASGLAAGKGVVIADNFEQAEMVAADMLVRNRFKSSGHEILVEAFMDGEEASIMLMVSGTDYVMLPVSQDHKRVGEGDTGPNTGGMGAYAPAALVTDALRATIITSIVEPTLKGMADEGIDYRGTLYIGIMIVDGQPKVVEFNVRFGDPECQILLPLLDADPVQILLDCAEGHLQPESVRVRDAFAVIVVMAAGGYPGNYRKGDVITLPKTIPEPAWILHAGTRLDDAGELVTAGGRVLGVVATGPSLKAACDTAYALCDTIQWKDAFYRNDIGWRQLKREPA